MEHRVRISQTGTADALAYEPFDLPQPGPDEALVRHRAIGVNMIDSYHRTGLYQVPLPATLGVEAAGVIEKLGSQGVYGLDGFGTGARGARRLGPAEG